MEAGSETVDSNLGKPYVIECEKCKKEFSVFSKNIKEGPKYCLPCYRKLFVLF